MCDLQPSMCCIVAKSFLILQLDFVCCLLIRRTDTLPLPHGIVSSVSLRHHIHRNSNAMAARMSHACTACSKGCRNLSCHA